jgi:hypothetical protein
MYLSLRDFLENWTQFSENKKIFSTRSLVESILRTNLYVLTSHGISVVQLLPTGDSFFDSLHLSSKRPDVPQFNMVFGPSTILPSLTNLTHSRYLHELNTSNDLISLSNEDDLGPLCADSGPSSHPLNAWNRHYFHRSQCHDASYDEATKRNEKAGLPPPKQRKCRTNRWVSHCECFSGRSKLHQRLRTWVPKGLNYCGQCDMFTRRKKSHNGRCASTPSPLSTLPDER